MPADRNTTSYSFTGAAFFVPATARGYAIRSMAKRRMALTKKTDKLDARGLAILLRNGTLLEVWIPPSELRDQRELLRLRIFLVRLKTRGG